MEEIIRIHDFLVVKANRNIPDSTQKGIPPSGYGQLENLLDRVRTYDIPKTNRSIVRIAARMYEAISRRHPFVDCNKRTAIVTVFETCLMNRYYLQKLDISKEVDFALKVASTELDDFGFQEICKHFEARIIPYKTFIARRFSNIYIKCPFCDSQHRIIPGKCQCGKQLVRINIIHHSLIKHYEFSFAIKELTRLSRLK